MDLTKKEIKVTEELLSTYNEIDFLVEQMNSSIDIIKADYNTYSSIDYSKDKISATNSVNSEVEAFLIKKEEQIFRLENDIKLLNKSKIKIEKAVDNLNPEERKLFNYIYVEKCNWIQVTDRLHISKNTYYRMKDKLIKKMTYIMNPHKFAKQLEYRIKRGYYDVDDWQ